jgi:xanthine dehydrogenase accessory factor
VIRAASLLGDPALERTARELLASGQPFALATVVYRRPPVSSHLGDRAIVTADGRLIGWIGGHCSQSAVRREALAAIQDGQPRLLRLSPDAEEGREAGRSTMPMACPSGGEVDVYIEPYGLAPRLVVVGSTPVARALGQLAEVVGLPVELVGQEGGAAELGGVSLGANDFVVVATAGAFDEEALARALRSGARYVALVASRRRAEAVREVLAESGLDPEALAHVRTPAGLDIGATTQEEIAVSILAEIIAEYRRGAVPAREVAETATLQPTLAEDPVCHMTVAVDDDAYTAEVRGTTYYFCCPHCRMRFLKDPDRYLAGA